MYQGLEPNPGAESFFRDFLSYDLGGATYMQRIEAKASVGANEFFFIFFVFLFLKVFLLAC